jgi:hypothetical protein
MAKVSGAAAAETMRGFVTNEPNMCLKTVWAAYEAHGAQPPGVTPAPAWEGWGGSAGKHPGDMNPPLGVPVYFGQRDWGNAPSAGDVVISLGNGRVVATDWPTWGVIGTPTLQERLVQTARPYMGWTETILNYPIDYGQTPGEETEDMSKVIRVKGRNDGFAGPGYFKSLSAEESSVMTQYWPIVDFGTNKRAYDLVKSSCLQGTSAPAAAK